MDRQQAKGELREWLRSSRANISESDFVQLSQKITATVQQQSEYVSAQTVHCYVSMNSRREVNTHPLIRDMKKEGKQVAVPVTHFKDGTLSHLRLRLFEDLVPNKWGVLEPGRGKKCPLSDIELVIVPMVGGDEQSNRIGYGGGFYDRFLKEITCPKIGLCFEQNIVPELPTEPFDIVLDKIITDRRIIS